ncbi:hypothetical protein PHJA_001945500 [Phtheirospermum japonicum]|uniref:Uncharacterized protein n=1 Tax=Phtheirospermum japonicum TaxID=374723 RepID=A0A830CPA7_9LAMI|nr:hypothetical protein PHJA_001945500 [Phtheirospermum japonicum]
MIGSEELCSDVLRVLFYYSCIAICCGFMLLQERYKEQLMAISDFVKEIEGFAIHPPDANPVKGKEIVNRRNNIQLQVDSRHISEQVGHSVSADEQVNSVDRALERAEQNVSSNNNDEDNII